MGSVEMSPDSNHVLQASAANYHWQGRGLLSLKSFRNGAANYRVDGHDIQVDERSYLVLNRDQEYTIGIDSARVVDAFCIFFRDGFAEEVLRTRNVDARTLVDDPDGVPPHVEFFQVTRPHDDILTPALNSLEASYPRRRQESGWLDEQMHVIMERLLRVQGRVDQEVQAVEAIRASTRTELYKRIHRARDFICFAYAESISLDDMAGVACLSVNHFLRTFKQILGQTPHQFLVSTRLARAAILLTDTDRSVTEVALAVGFESPGSFSWLFRRRFGVSPTGFRNTKK